MLSEKKRSFFHDVYSQTTICVPVDQKLLVKFFFFSISENETDGPGSALAPWSRISDIWNDRVPVQPTFLTQLMPFLLFFIDVYRTVIYRVGMGHRRPSGAESKRRRHLHRIRFRTTRPPVWGSRTVKFDPTDPPIRPLAASAITTQV